MTLETKDIIYILLYIISMISMFLAFRYEVKELRKDVTRGQKVLYQDAGNLNVIDVNTCKRYRDEVFESIRRTERAFEMFLVEAREIKEKLIYLTIKVDEFNKFKKDQNNV